MQFQNMNIDALQRVTNFIVGPDGTAVVAKTYHLVEAAMQAAYNEGHLAGRALAHENVEERLDNAFDEGFEQGAAFQELEDEADTAQTADECYEDGYLDGVEDARFRSELADHLVQQVINERAAYHFDRLDLFNESNVQDRGDEHLFDEA